MFILYKNNNIISNHALVFSFNRFTRHSGLDLRSLDGDIYCSDTSKDSMECPTRLPSPFRYCTAK